MSKKESALRAEKKLEFSMKELQEISKLVDAELAKLKSSIETFKFESIKAILAKNED